MLHKKAGIFVPQFAGKIKASKHQPIREDFWQYQQVFSPSKVQMPKNKSATSFTGSGASCIQVSASTKNLGTRGEEPVFLYNKACSEEQRGLYTGGGPTGIYAFVLPEPNCTRR
jgi:hypothetical protein